MASTTTRTMVRLPEEIYDLVERFRDLHEASSSEDRLSQNKALITLIKRGLAVSPELRVKLRSGVMLAIVAPVTDEEG